MDNLTITLHEHKGTLTIAERKAILDANIVLVEYTPKVVSKLMKWDFRKPLPQKFIDDKYTKEFFKFLKNNKKTVFGTEFNTKDKGTQKYEQLNLQLVAFHKLENKYIKEKNIAKLTDEKFTLKGAKLYIEISRYRDRVRTKWIKKNKGALKGKVIQIIGAAHEETLKQELDKEKIKYKIKKAYGGKLTPFQQLMQECAKNYPNKKLKRHLIKELNKEIKRDLN